MKVLLKLKAPDEAVLTLQSEMTVAEAKRIHSKLTQREGGYDYAADDFAGHLKRAIERATTAFGGAEIPDRS